MALPLHLTIPVTSTNPTTLSTLGRSLARVCREALSENIFVVFFFIVLVFLAVIGANDTIQKVQVHLAASTHSTRWRRARGQADPVVRVHKGCRHLMRGASSSR